MGEIIESRSRETANHIRRVAEYSTLLAKFYGLSEREQQHVLHTSPMHDAGKIAIPDSILNKPGKLTDEEFTLMKEHAKKNSPALYQKQQCFLATIQRNVQGSMMQLCYTMLGILGSRNMRRI